MELSGDLKQTDRYRFLLASIAGNKDIIQFLHSENDQLIHGKYNNGDTAVTLACKHADLETVKLLEKLGADINQTGQEGRNGLLVASEKGKKEIIKGGMGDLSTFGFQTMQVGFLV